MSMEKTIDKWIEEQFHKGIGYIREKNRMATCNNIDTFGDTMLSEKGGGGRAHVMWYNLLY